MFVRAIVFPLVFLCGCAGSGAGNTDDGEPNTDGADTRGTGSADTGAGSADGADDDDGMNDTTGPIPDMGTPGPPIQGCVEIASGSWQEITPPDLHREWWCTPDFNPDGCGNAGDSERGKIATYGAHYVALAPSEPGTVYLGTSSLGFWRSTDCGATWELPDGGDTDVAAGRNWTIAVDPHDAQTVYTTAGYGQGGVYKSTDGGANWQQMLTPEVAAVAWFVEKITLDPTDAEHVLVSFHDACLQGPVTADMFPATTPLDGNLPVGAPISDAGNGEPGWGCLAESHDGGVHWTLATAALAWEGLDGPGQAMVDATTWFYASNSSSGIFLTTTAGASPDGTSPGWTQVIPGNVPGSVYVAPDGRLYTGGSNTILRSENGVDWTPISDATLGLGSFNGSTPFVQGGSRLYAAQFSWEAPVHYYVSDVDRPSFAPLAADAAGISMGAGQLEYDEQYGVLYSSNMVGGLWRFKP